VRLPFLQEKDHWPAIKETEEIVVNPSHDAQLQDHLLDELLIALESKNHKEIAECLKALIHSINNEESADAVNAWEE
jgi:hypothetical protein